MNATKEEVQKAFEVWRIEYLANPEKFTMSDLDSEAYGIACADYFIKKLNEVQNK